MLFIVLKLIVCCGVPAQTNACLMLKALSVLAFLEEFAPGGLQQSASG